MIQLVNSTIKFIEVYMMFLIFTLSLLTIGCSDEVDELIQKLKDEDSDVRIDAAQKLGEIGDKRAIEPLIACLKDEDFSVQSSAARSLGYIGDNRAVEPLINCLKYENSFVRDDVAFALGEIGDNRAFEPLLACLKDEKCFQENVADALAKIGDSLAIEPLITCLKDNNRYVNYSYDNLYPDDDQWSIAKALCKIGKPAILSLSTCLTNENYNVRRNATYALGEIGDQRVVDLLINQLKDEDWVVRYYVAEALGKIGDKKAIQPLASVLPDWHSNTVICQTLEKLGWIPINETEQVYFWIGTKKKNLILNWEKTKNILLNDTRSGVESRIQNAVYTFISVGREEIIDELIRILNEDGNETMAETFLNCGNNRLEEAAKNWAIKYGYSIMPGGSRGAVWGNW